MWVGGHHATHASGGAVVWRCRAIAPSSVQLAGTQRAISVVNSARWGVARDLENEIESQKLFCGPFHRVVVSQLGQTAVESAQLT